MKHFASILALGAFAVLGAGAVQAQDPWGSATQDVPTYRPGDTWNFTRTFEINVSAIFNVIGTLNAKLEVNLDFTDNYTLTQTGVSTVEVAPPAFDAAFTTYTAAANVRSRTAGALTAVGTGRLDLISADPENPIDPDWVDLALTTAVGDSSTGYNWTGVGDLSQIREQFEVPYVLTTLTVTSGTPQACALLSAFGSQILPNNIWCPCTPTLVLAGTPCFPTAVGSTNVTTIYTRIDISLDHEVNGQGLEILDFPFIDPYQDDQTGEQFTVEGNRILHGVLELDPDGVPGDELLLEEFATNPPIAMDYDIRLEDLNATDPVTAATGLVYLQGQGAAPYNDPIYYSPANKELKRWDLGSVGFSSGTPGLDGYLALTVDAFRTINTAATLQAGSNMSAFAMVPERPELAQTFTVSGSTTGTDTQVTMRLILPGDTFVPVVVPITAGNFTANLLAPNLGDESDWKVDSAERESGSYGVEIIRNGTSGGYERKVITARFAPISSAQDWELYD